MRECIFKRVGDDLVEDQSDGDKPVKERGPQKGIPEIVAATREKMAQVKGLDFFVFEFPSIPGYSNVEGLDVVLQDKTGLLMLDAQLVIANCAGRSI